MDIQVTDFNISQILECGQIFRFYKIAKDNFNVIANNKLINIAQKENVITINNTSPNEFNSFWRNYLDLNTDYSNIKSELKQIDINMNNAINFGSGIRILRQDPFEMLISFIISQNKSIPHIKQCIQNISTRFGKIIEQNISSETYFAFPTLEELQKATIEDLKECKVGFRAPYIKDAIDKLSSNEVDLLSLINMETNEARAQLEKIKGVGPKIANCVLLFAYYKTDVFPTDVWIKRIIEGCYFDGKETKLEEIDKFAKTTFKDLAGFAQQYLFFYARENNLFKKNNKTA
ncbi:8-oxoguanine DNA glycosylase [Candidatus Epulonipiscioides gigas]|nr:8-oxoguanine DNA glycosylase [Epulopiscium sp. SCG-C07WGA-EpuloA2]